MTTIQGILIPADGLREIELVDIDQDDYKSIQQHVGGPFEMTELLRPEASLWSNEEGKIHDLELNRRATLMLWVHRTEFREADYIVGDVLVLGPADKAGRTMGAPEELVNLLFHTEQYRYLVQVTNDDTWNGNGVTYDNWVDAYNGGLALAKRWILVENVKVIAA
jgi:hypothetical protein